MLFECYPVGSFRLGKGFQSTEGCKLVAPAGVRFALTYFAAAFRSLSISLSQARIWFQLGMLWDANIIVSDSYFLLDRIFIDCGSYLTTL